MKSVLKFNPELLLLLFLFFLVQRFLAGFVALATLAVRAGDGAVVSAGIASAEAADVAKNRSPVIGRRFFHHFFGVRHDQRRRFYKWTL